MPETDLGRVDFEPYFLAWDSVLFYPASDNPSNRQISGYRGDNAAVPCHQHITCNGLVLAEEKYPPRICPHCHIDTTKQVEKSITAKMAGQMLKDVDEGTSQGLLRCQNCNFLNFPTQERLDHEDGCSNCGWLPQKGVILPDGVNTA